MGINPDDARDAIKAAKRTKPTPLAPVVALPTGDKDQQRRQKFTHGALNHHADVLAATKQGNRHTQLLLRARVLGGLLWTGHITPADINNALKAACTVNGYDTEANQTQIERTIEDGCRHGAGEPILDFFDNMSHDETNWAAQWARHVASDLERVTLAHSMVDTFWNTRPLLRHIYDTAQQARVGPFAYLGATLAHLLANTPHRVCLPGITGPRGSLNLLFALVGPSGAGKGVSAGLAHQLWEFDPLPEIPLNDHANTSQKPVIVNIGSGEGFAHVYGIRHRGEDHRTNYNALFKVDEIDTLTALAGRKGSTIMSVLRSVYSGERLGFQNADGTRRIQINDLEYRAALIAGVQPLRAANLMAGADGGTPQRFVWLPVDDPTAPNTLINKPVQTVRHRMPNFTQELDNNLELKLPDIIIKTVQDSRLHMLQNQEEAAKDTAGHDTLTRIKLAALLAILGETLTTDFDGRLTTSGSRTTITDDDWNLAGQLLTLSICERTNIQHKLAQKAAQDRQRQYIATIEGESAAAATIEDKVRQDIIKLLKKTPPEGGWRRNRLRRGITRNRRSTFDTEFAEMVKAGELHINDGVVSMSTRLRREDGGDGGDGGDDS